MNYIRHFAKYNSNVQYLLLGKKSGLFTTQDISFWGGVGGMDVSSLPACLVDDLQVVTAPPPPKKNHWNVFAC